MRFETKIKDIQENLSKAKIDGWLLYDFRRSNDLACEILEIPADRLLTRRFFYWIPFEGTPVKIVHAIEPGSLEHLPGKMLTYRSWLELETHLNFILQGSNQIAMEYSPRNAIPYLSKVDAGTMDLIRNFGPEVVSSADLLQKYTSVWDAHKLATHLAAAEVLCNTVDNAWKLIADCIKTKQAITEYEVQQFILGEFSRYNCIASDSPICAVNAHSADPHYCAVKAHATTIKAGDFILIDLWCKKDVPGAAYADITRVGVAADKPTAKQQTIFNIVKDARDAGTKLVMDRFSQGQPVMGLEVDQCCRDVINEAGYGEFFLHRTGHNIGEKDHGNGANLDNLETQDSRLLLKGTCFSIEPGIYLSGDFGVRLEYDVYVHHNGQVQVTGGIQESIECLCH
jgi:Xaa-Pro dipeptidase